MVRYIVGCPPSLLGEVFGDFVSATGAPDVPRWHRDRKLLQSLLSATARPSAFQRTRRGSDRKVRELAARDRVAQRTSGVVVASHALLPDDRRAVRLHDL